MPKLESQLRIDANTIIAGVPGAGGSSPGGSVFSTCDGDTQPDTILKTCADGQLRVRYFGVGVAASVNGPRITADGEVGFDVASTQAGQDVIYLLDDSNGAGSGNIGPSIGFGGPGVDARRAAFGAIQTGSDIDQVGFVWHTHPSATGAADLVEGMRLDHNGNLTVAGTIDSVDLATFNAVQFVTLAGSASLPNERILTPGDGMAPLVDGGAGGAVTFAVDLATNSGLTFSAGDLALGTPGSVSAASANSVTTTTHTHDAVTTADGAANVSTILQSDANGDLALRHIDLIHDTAFDTGSANSDQDGLYIDSANTATLDAYGNALVWGRVDGSGDLRLAAIASKQTGSDIDQVGMAFFVHPSATSSNPMVEGMELDHNGDLTINGDVFANNIITSAIADAPFITVSNDANLTNERALAVSGDLTLNDGGAGNAISISVNTTPDAAGFPGIILKPDANGDASFRRLTVDDRLIHDGDADTYIEFTPDQADFTIGGLSMLTLTESTQDLITLGPGSGDVDINFNGDMFLLGSSGFLGIGTTGPLDPLHISSAEPTIRLSDTDAALDTDVSALIEWWRGENTSRVAWLGPGDGDLSVSNEVTGGSILFRVNGNEFESFIMDENGRFGVGTLTPQVPLDVRSTIRVAESNTVYGQISHVASDNSLLIETSDGSIRFNVGGSSLDSLIVDSSSLNVIVNDGQGSADFIVKGDGIENLFYVDAVNDKVGIGTSTPDNIFHVLGSSGISAVHVEETNGTTAPRTLLALENNGAPGIELIDNNASLTVSIAQFGAGVDISSALNTTLFLTTAGDTSSKRLPSISFVHPNGIGARISAQRDSGNSDGMHLDFYTETIGGSLTLRAQIFEDGGVAVGTATGGSKGAGTINVSSNVYLNNSAYTNPDFILEKWATGKVEKFKDSPGAEGYDGLMPLDKLRDFMKENLHLPGRDSEPSGIFDRADLAQRWAEELHLYILELHDRISDLERRR